MFLDIIPTLSKKGFFARYYGGCALFGSLDDRYKKSYKGLIIQLNSKLTTTVIIVDSPNFLTNNFLTGLVPLFTRYFWQ